MVCTDNLLRDHPDGWGDYVQVIEMGTQEPPSKGQEPPLQVDGDVTAFYLYPNPQKTSKRLLCLCDKVKLDRSPFLYIVKTISLYLGYNLEQVRVGFYR